jgi:cob(I)alamin adenosyltransferase
MSDWLTWVAKKGDDGLIFLGDGFRVEKNSPRVKFIGTIGELNSWIGLIVASCENEKLKSTSPPNRHQIATENQRQETTGKQQHMKIGYLQRVWSVQGSKRNDQKSRSVRLWI